MFGAEVLFDAETAESVRDLMIRATGGCACEDGRPCRLLDIAAPELRTPPAVIRPQAS